MRDALILFIVAAGAIAALRRPWIGVLLWTWLSLLNPHRFAWGYAYDAPLAAVAAGTTMIGLFATKDKESPFRGAPVVWFVLFMIWITASWRLGFDPDRDYSQWSKVMKIDIMILLALAVIRTKLQIVTLAWVVTVSLAVLGVKGGVFTIAHGGSFRVWGPPQSFIQDNNEFALALIMTIPFLRFLQLQVASRWWLKQALTVSMLLCAASAFGSQSRGALVAITAMAFLLWWRGRSRAVGGVLIAAAGFSLVAFMPDSWTERMGTIDNYQDDRSALGRISAWWTAFGIAKNYFFGTGFNMVRAELFAAYSPYPDFIHAAHSIYFLVLGNHGFIGLFLFVMIWISTWVVAGQLRRSGPLMPQTQWCADLGAMAQVSLIGYLVGGAFLSLSYFDLPYNTMVLVVAARMWILRESWKTERSVAWRWWMPPGARVEPEPSPRGA